MHKSHLHIWPNQTVQKFLNNIYSFMHTHEGAKRRLDITHTVTVYMRMSHLMYMSHLTFWVNFSTKKCDLYSNKYGN